ncbi:ATP-binding protein [Vibrio vulnificus]|uniref:AAA family ATPase n=1 Tax=Vibrio vulnificus TaxID=672 RepID=UPI001028887C|nr:AAA family ATPase [Vibrio vulnificus]RZP96963.1 ATP-binding protein [Vibrio vulnificus]
MLSTISINNYRSVRDLCIPLEQLNLITGTNSSGKSNLYRALRLLSETAQHGVVSSLAAEGGLGSAFWAGPESFSQAMYTDEVPVQGVVSKKVKRVRLGFATEHLSYAISLGLPIPSQSAFALDPEIKHESIWYGEHYHPSALIAERKGPLIRVKDASKWQVISQHVHSSVSLFDQINNPAIAPDIFLLREFIRSWRFYGHFRTDKDAPSRQPQIGTRTPVLHHEGDNLAAALQTIREQGHDQMLDEAIADAFPRTQLAISRLDDDRFVIHFHQHGLLRPLSGAELSDGTLRFLLWIAALLSPSPPPLMVLNEPETSLHPDLLPALARLIIRASKRTQVWVISHSNELIAALENMAPHSKIQLKKQFGETIITSRNQLNKPFWSWPDKR